MPGVLQFFFRREREIRRRVGVFETRGVFGLKMFFKLEHELNNVVVINLYGSFGQDLRLDKDEDL